MKVEGELLETQLAEHRETARRLKAYIQELTETCAKCGTDTSLLDADILKAKNDSHYHEQEAERLGGLIGQQRDKVAFSVYKDAAGEWRWRLQATNGRIVADSGEGYEHKQDCLHAIELVKGSKDAPVNEKR